MSDLRTPKHGEYGGDERASGGYAGAAADGHRPMRHPRGRRIFLAGAGVVGVAGAVVGLSVGLSSGHHKGNRSNVPRPTATGAPNPGASHGAHKHDAATPATRPATADTQRAPVTRGFCDAMTAEAAQALGVSASALACDSTNESGNGPGIILDKTFITGGAQSKSIEVRLGRKTGPYYGVWGTPTVDGVKADWVGSGVGDTTLSIPLNNGYELDVGNSLASSSDPGTLGLTQRFAGKVLLQLYS